MVFAAVRVRTSKALRPDVGTQSLRGCEGKAKKTPRAEMHSRARCRTHVGTRGQDPSRAQSAGADRGKLGRA